MSVDRRIHPRVLVDIQAEVGVDPAFNVQTMENLSLGGCFVRTAVPEAVGALVTIRFSLPGDDQPPVRAVGRVAWHRADPFTRRTVGMGVQFIALDDPDMGALATYITGYAS